MFSTWCSMPPNVAGRPFCPTIAMCSGDHAMWSPPVTRASLPWLFTTPLQRRFGDHARRDGPVGGLVDEDEPPGGPVAAVGVAHQRLRRAELNAADVVEPQRLRLFVAVQRVDVEPVAEALDDRARRPRGVLDVVLRTDPQRGRLVP